HFDAFVFRYDIMELNTAVKPYMFEWLRMRNPEAGLVYLDPDIYVLRPLDEVAQAFANCKLAVLTPHLNAPLPDDGKFPTELSLMRTGAYNCGFVAINAAHPQSAALSTGGRASWNSIASSISKRACSPTRNGWTWRQVCSPTCRYCAMTATTLRTGTWYRAPSLALSTVATPPTGCR